MKLSAVARRVLAFTTALSISTVGGVAGVTAAQAAPAQVFGAAAIGLVGGNQKPFFANGPWQAAATQNVMSACQRSGATRCLVVMWAKNAYMALALAPRGNGPWGVGWAATQNQAIANADHGCVTANSVSACAGRVRAISATGAPGPNVTGGLVHIRWDKPPTRLAAVTGRARCGVTVLPQNKTTWKNAFKVRIQALNGEARDASVLLGLWATTFSQVTHQGEKATAYVYCTKSDSRPNYGKTIDIKAPATWWDLSFAKRVVVPTPPKKPTAAQLIALTNALKALQKSLPSVSLPPLPKAPTADQISAWADSVVKAIQSKSPSPPKLSGPALGEVCVLLNVPASLGSKLGADLRQQLKCPAIIGK